MFKNIVQHDYIRQYHKEVHKELYHDKLTILVDNPCVAQAIVIGIINIKNLILFWILWLLNIVEIRM